MPTMLRNGYVMKISNNLMSAIGVLMMVIGMFAMVIIVIYLQTEIVECQNSK